MLDTAGPRVGHVIDAIIAKFKNRFSGIDPDRIQVYVLSDDGTSSTLVDSMQTLSEAGIHANTRLVVELTSLQSLTSAAGV